MHIRDVLARDGMTASFEFFPPRTDEAWRGFVASLAEFEALRADVRRWAALAARSMQWQVTVQDGSIWVSDGQQSVELSPLALKSAAR